MIKPLPIDELDKEARKDIIIAVGGAGANILKSIYYNTDSKYHKKTRFTVIGNNPEMLAKLKMKILNFIGLKGTLKITIWLFSLELRKQY